MKILSIWEPASTRRRPDGEDDDDDNLHLTPLYARLASASSHHHSGRDTERPATASRSALWSERAVYMSGVSGAQCSFTQPSLLIPSTIDGDTQSQQFVYSHLPRR